MTRFITFLLLLFVRHAFATSYTVVSSGNWSNTNTWTPSGVPGSGDTVHFNFNPSSPLTLTVDGNYTINSLHFNGYGNISTPGKITIINGTGSITLTENGSWTGGFISGNVQLTIPTGKTFELYAGSDDSNRKYLENNALVTNDGTIYWGGTGIFFEDAAQIVNNGTFVDNTIANRLYRNDGNTSNIGFVNNGTFDAYSTECDLHTAFVNNGTINIHTGWAHSQNMLDNNGTIRLYSSGISNHQFKNYDGTGGTIEFHANTSLEIFGDGMNAIVGTITGSGGTLIFANSNPLYVTVVDEPIPSGILLDFAQGGRVTLNSDQTLMSDSGFAKEMDGTGSLTIPVGVTMTWTRGYIGGDVGLIVNDGGILLLSPGDNKEIRDNGLLTNHGTVEQADHIGLSSSQIMIENTGTFNIVADVHCYSNATLPLIDNSGTFRKSAGSATSTIGTGFTNNSSGILSAESGTLSFIKTVNNVGTLMGNATFVFPNGQSLGGTIAPGTSIGTLSIQASSLTLSADLQIEVNGSSTDQLQISGTMTLSGASLSVSEAGSPLTPGLNANVVQASGISGSFSSTSFPSAGYNLNTSGGTVTLSNAPLPLHLTAFHGHCENTANFLDWETTQEVQTDRFDIERSTDGHSWETLGSVQASMHTDHTVRYSFQDAMPLPSAYYRLKMLDLDGTFNYSWIVALSRQGLVQSSGHMTLFPNPCRQLLLASLPPEAAGPSRVTVTGMEGQVLQSFIVDNRSDRIDLDLSTLPAGTFILSVQTEKERYTGRFRKL
ncbi:MAG: hypothetical protein RLY31_2039 [Bacteroidota bacterium]